MPCLLNIGLIEAVTQAENIFQRLKDGEKDAFATILKEFDRLVGSFPRMLSSTVPITPFLADILKICPQCDITNMDSIALTLRCGLVEHLGSCARVSKCCNTFHRLLACSRKIEKAFGCNATKAAQQCQ